MRLMFAFCVCFFSQLAFSNEVVHLESFEYDGAKIHVVSIDLKYFELQIVMNQTGKNTRPCEMLQTHSAIAAMNGGFFAYVDALQQESVADGNLIAKSQTISMSNSPLPTFGWSKSGAAILTQLAKKTEALPSWVDFAISGRPALIQDGVIPEWDLATLKAVKADMKVPRSGICKGKEGVFRLFTASQGTIVDFAQIAMRIGCQEAINLDGGSSSSLDYLGQSLMHQSCMIERAVHNTILVIDKARVQDVL